MPRFDERYAAAWARFTHLTETVDSLAKERRGLRRWLLRPYVALIIPINDPAVLTQLTAWQASQKSNLAYEPLDVDRLHITLHYLGDLRHQTWPWMPHTWRREKLDQLAGQIDKVLHEFEPFEVRLGPLNAFPNALIAEVQDTRDCLRSLRARVLRALPFRARPISRWPYLPHVTLGYWGQKPVPPIIGALKAYRDAEPITYRVARIKFTIYYRDKVPVSAQMINQPHEEIVAEFQLTPNGD